MNTTYEDIYDIASIRFSSYSLDGTFIRSESDYKAILKAYLQYGINALVKIEIGGKFLEEYTDNTLDTFTVPLRGIIKNILADYILIAWLDSQINDETAIIDSISDSKFKKSSSTANLLNSNISKRDQISRIIDSQIHDYVYHVSFLHGEN